MALKGLFYSAKSTYSVCITSNLVIFFLPSILHHKGQPKQMNLKGYTCLFNSVVLAVPHDVVLNRVKKITVVIGVLAWGRGGEEAAIGTLSNEDQIHWLFVSQRVKIIQCVYLLVNGKTHQAHTHTTHTHHTVLYQHLYFSHLMVGPFATWVLYVCVACVLCI